MNKLPVAVAVIAHNEERNLPRCLESVKDWTSQIVVVTNDCTDRTVEIARGFSAEVHEHPWTCHRDQKNATLPFVRQPWVLALDADEAVSGRLRDEIQAFFAGGAAEDHDGACFPRLNHFLGRALRHGDAYPDISLRLFRTGRARWGGVEEHDRIELKGRLRRLDGDLLHFSNQDIKSHTAKINVFSDYFLRRKVAAGKRWSLPEAVVRPLWRFFRAYVLRLGFLDGFPGFYLSVATAFATFVRYTRLYEHERAASVPASGGR